MEKSNRRAARCALEYTVFVLMLLLAVGGMLALFHFFSGNTPTLLSTPVSAEPDECFTVILDAGHGGEDGGAVGKVNGREVCEKELNLSIALLLRDLLEADGVNVIMTREEDVLLYDRNTDYEGRKKVLDLAARLAIGQNTEGAMFVSIHMNAFPQTQYRGLQVYYSPNHPLSQTLALDMQTRVSEQLQSDNHRKIKRAGSDIYLLENLNCPAVLVECGFLSNPEECALLADAAYRRQLAFLLFCSIRECMDKEAEERTAGGAIALDAEKGNFITEKTEIAAEGLIFASKYYIINAEHNNGKQSATAHREVCAAKFSHQSVTNQSQKSKTEDTRHERNQDRLYLLGMRNEKPQVAGKMPDLRCLEFLC